MWIGKKSNNDNNTIVFYSEIQLTYAGRERERDQEIKSHLIGSPLIDLIESLLIIQIHLI